MSEVPTVYLVKQGNLSVQRTRSPAAIVQRGRTQSAEQASVKTVRKGNLQTMDLRLATTVA